MKIYTKKGDTGETSLLGGLRVKKSNARIDAYGTVDELNSHIGLLRDNITGISTAETTAAFLLDTQDKLFTIGASLAAQPGKKNLKLPALEETVITQMESEIDLMDAALPPMRSFVLPCGHTVVSICHIARCVCRRAERLVVGLAETESVEPIVVKYLNRLSDYLFMLSRKLANDLKIKEIPWKPQKGKNK